MAINEAIKKHRKDSGLTQTQLANILGVKRSTIARYESGDITPPTDTLFKLQDIFRDDFLYEVMGMPFDYEETFDYKLINELSYYYSTLESDDGKQFDYIVTKGRKVFVVAPEDVHEFCNRTKEYLEIAFKHFLLDKGTYNGQFDDELIEDSYYEGEKETE